jgi:hypothetical protein
LAVGSLNFSERIRRRWNSGTLSTGATVPNHPAVNQDVFRSGPCYLNSFLQALVKDGRRLLRIWAVPGA